MQVDTLMAAVADAQITHQSGLRKVTWNLLLELGEIPRVRCRMAYFDDVRGQRTGTQTSYSTHSIGWGHWFNVWGENTGLFRPELGYEHSYNAPAYNLGTRKDQLIVAADVIFLY